MARRLHVRSVAPAVLAETLGPAEGQYTTASFQDTIEQDYSNTFCLDSYAFTLREAGTVCIELTRDTVPTTGCKFDFVPYSLESCEFIQPEIAILCPETTGSQCYDLPAGAYEVWVGGWDDDGGDLPWPYTITFDSTAPLWDVSMAQDEACGGYIPEGCDVPPPSPSRVRLSPR
jgi:hypothetical protein